MFSNHESVVYDRNAASFVVVSNDATVGTGNIVAQLHYPLLQWVTHYLQLRVIIRVYFKCSAPNNYYNLYFKIH